MIATQWLLDAFVLILSASNVLVAWVLLRLGRSLERQGEETTRSYRAIEAKLKIIADAVLSLRTSERTPQEENSPVAAGKKSGRRSSGRMSAEVTPFEEKHTIG